MAAEQMGREPAPRDYTAEEIAQFIRDGELEGIDDFLLANSTRPELRDALFDLVLSIGRRNSERFPDLSSDEVLEELERPDKERHVTA